MVVHADVADVIGHVLQRAFPPDGERLLVARGVVLQDG